MNPGLLYEIYTDYPLTTPLVFLEGSLRVDRFFTRTINAWPDIKQVIDYFAPALNPANYGL